MEGRDVAIADVMGAYMLATMNDYVLIKLTGKPVDIMCGISKEYRKYVVLESGRRVLYLRFKRLFRGVCNRQYYGTTHSREGLRS